MNLKMGDRVKNLKAGIADNFYPQMANFVTLILV
jgi:hypothetical protein